MCPSTNAETAGHHRFAAALLLAAGVLLHGAAAAQNFPPFVADYIANAKAHVKTMGIESFKSALDQSATGLLIDVREPNEFASGHVPGAISIPRGLIETRIWQHLGFPEKTDLDRKITLYCSTGVRDVLAAKSLQDLGFRNVTAVDMRIEEWIKAGYPLTKD